MTTRWSWVTRTMVALALWTGSACTSEPAECGTGTDGCPCEAGDVCDEGLVCSDRTCRTPREITLAVDDRNARACEVLLRDASAEVASVRFEGASGAHVREEPLTSLSFAASADGPIAASAVRVQVVGSGDFTVETSRCFDSQGHELSGASVRIGG